MIDLTKHFGKEVYVLCSDEDSGDTMLKIYERLSQLQGGMVELHVGSAHRLRVLHGVMCPANVLPSGFRSRTPYLVIPIPDDSPQAGKPGESGRVLESTASSVLDLARDLQGILHVKETRDLDLSKTGVLYGYEIGICLSVVEDDVDEETIETCKEIFKEVEGIKKAEGINWRVSAE